MFAAPASTSVLPGLILVTKFSPVKHPESATLELKVHVPDLRQSTQSNQGIMGVWMIKKKLKSINFSHGA